MIALVRLHQIAELVALGLPVKVARVNDDATHEGRVTIHVLGGGVHHDVGTPFDGTAEHGRGEGVVDDQRQALGVGCRRKGLDIEHGKRGVGNRLAKDKLSVGLDRSANLVHGGARAHEGRIDAKALERKGEQVDGTAIDGRAGDDVVAAGAQVEHGDERGHLARAGEDGAYATLHGGNLLLNKLAGRV